MNRTEEALRRRQREKTKRQRRFLALLAALFALALLVGGVRYFRQDGGAGGELPTVRTFAEEPASGTAASGTGETAGAEKRVTARIRVLDVGQGSAMLIESGGEAMLVDGGPSENASRVVACLRGCGVTSLKYVLATHFDADHLAGVIAALEVFPVETLLTSDYRAEGSCYESFLRHAKTLGLRETHPRPGDEFRLGDCRFTIYAPNGSVYEERNDHSLAFRLTDGTSSLLCTGDAELYSETEMLLRRDERPLKSDIYIVGHHGSLSSSSANFLKEVDPDYAVISCGRGNDYGFPGKTTVENLRRMKTALFRTDLQGDIVCLFTGDGIVWEREPCNDFTPGDK